MIELTALKTHNYSVQEDLGVTTSCWILEDEFFKVLWLCYFGYSRSDDSYLFCCYLQHISRRIVECFVMRIDKGVTYHSEHSMTTIVVIRMLSTQMDCSSIRSVVSHRLTGLMIEICPHSLLLLMIILSWVCICVFEYKYHIILLNNNNNNKVYAWVLAGYRGSSCLP